MEELISRLDTDLSHLGGTPATRSWPDYGEIVLVGSREEAVRLSDRHVRSMARHYQMLGQGLGFITSGGFVNIPSW